MTIEELISNCRRGKNVDRNYQSLLELLDDDKVLNDLDSRWLISVCDTIADHDACAKARSNALMLSVWLNTIKLWATQNLMTGTIINDKVYQRLKMRSQELWDGMMAFRPISPRGDVTWNMFSRMNRELEESPLVYKIYKILVERLQKTNNPLNGLDKLHGNVFKNA